MFLNRVEETHLIYQQIWMAVKYALRGLFAIYVLLKSVILSISWKMWLLNQERIIDKLKFRNKNV